MSKSKDTMADETSDKKSKYVELLKYPVIVFSILIALILAKYTLGITFGPVSEISGEGVKFSQTEKAEFTELSSKLNSALAAIEELQKLVPSSGDSASDSARVVIFEAAQTVSDQTAKIAKLSADDVDPASWKGYIWIGNYGDNWTTSRLALIKTGQPISTAPHRLVPGTEYQVLGNMVVRDGLPADDSGYYIGIGIGRKSLGIIPRGTKIRLVTTPVGIDRGFAVQYWAQIELP